MAMPQGRRIEPSTAQARVPAVGVLVVEDDAIVRAWIRLALERSEFWVAGEAATCAEAVELARRRPGVILVDQHLPDGLGSELVRELRLAGVACPAVLITARAERGLNERARAAGAQGTILKRGSVDDLLAGLRAAACGEERFDEAHPRGVSSAPTLSPREREVLELVAGGRTNRQVARELGLSPETVKTLLERLYRKLGVRGRAEAVSVGHERGLL